jgi:hypothetical protein
MEIYGSITGRVMITAFAMILHLPRSFRSWIKEIFNVGFSQNNLIPEVLAKANIQVIYNIHDLKARGN